MLGHQKHNRWLPFFVAFLGIFAGAALLLLVAGSGATAAASPRLQVFTKPGGLATREKVRVVVRGADKGFQAIAGATGAPASAQSISQPIFAPVAKGQGSNYLGQDPIAFLRRPAFPAEMVLVLRGRSRLGGDPGNRG